jgi:transposase
VTETLEVVPRRWKVIQTVRERFSCRQCETITQPRAAFPVTPRGFDPQAWLADVLARSADTPQTKLAALPPWNWRGGSARQEAA